jgi:hypothetical protein
MIRESPHRFRWPASIAKKIGKPVEFLAERPGAPIVRTGKNMGTIWSVTGLFLRLAEGCPYRSQADKIAVDAPMTGIKDPLLKPPSGCSPTAASFPQHRVEDG